MKILNARKKIIVSLLVLFSVPVYCFAQSSLYGSTNPSMPTPIGPSQSAVIGGPSSNSAVSSAPAAPVQPTPAPAPSSPNIPGPPAVQSGSSDQGSAPPNPFQQQTTTQSDQTTTNALTAGPASSQSSSPIPHCESNKGYMVKNWVLYLNPDKATPRIFVFHGISTGIVVINQPSVNSNIYGVQPVYTVEQALPGFPQSIHFGSWSVYATNQRNVELACMTYAPPRLGYADCTQALSICSYEPPSNPGTQWLAQDQSSIDSVLNVLQKRQLLLPENQ